jgi:hypothetical protein
MDDEYEQQKRRDYINQVRFNNKVDMQADQMELVRRLSRMKGPDRVAKWKEDAEERQRQHEEERAALTEQQSEHLATVEQQIRAMVTDAIATEREFLEEIVGQAIGELLAREREDAKSELAAEARKLWAVLTEVQSTLAAYNRAASATSKAVIDLPNPLSSRSH